MTPPTSQRHEETTRVLLVGLGTIARTHAAVLTRRQDVELLGGVDPRAAAWFNGPRWTSLDEAVGAVGEPDLVVLTTPTDTHADLADLFLTTTSARVLSEKPLAATTAGIAALEARHGSEVLRKRLAVAHHFAFSPEVEWASELVQREGWGLATSVLSVFNDAYARLPARRLDSLVSSWVDSGPNQLSVLAAFPDGYAGDAGWPVLTHTARRDRSVTTLDHGAGRTVLSSNWVAGDSSKQTTVEFADGAVRLHLDHTSMTVLLRAEGAPVEHVGYAGAASRKEAHYLGMYRRLLGSRPGADERLGVPLARSIAATLEAATRAPGDPGLAFSEVAEADAGDIG